MTPEDLEFFKVNGYLVLDQFLSDDETARFLDVFERQQRDYGRFWTNNGIWQTQYCQSLLTAPEFDDIIRHKNVMEPLQALMGGEVSFGQMCLNNMAPYKDEPVAGMRTWDGAVGRRWHRDGGSQHPYMFREHPLRIGFMRLQLFLTDVDDTTHGFSISPQSIDQEIMSIDDHLAANGFHDIHGRAGAAVLFNISSIHTVLVQPTQAERKTVGIYYGHRNRRYHSDASYFPPAFWRDHPDEETRGFYGVVNDMSRRFQEHTAGRDDIPVNETLEILQDLDAGG